MHFDLFLLSELLCGLRWVSREGGGWSASGAIPLFPRYEPFKDSLDLHLLWHYVVLFDTESDAIKVCGTYNSVGHYVILYVYDTVMCMVLYDTVSECGFSHIFTSKGRGSG